VANFFEIGCCVEKVNITATNVGSAIAYNTDVTLRMAANVTFENASVIGYDTELIPGTCAIVRMRCVRVRVRRVCAVCVCVLRYCG
jgi:hypothetical protein